VQTDVGDSSKYDDYNYDETKRENLDAGGGGSELDREMIGSYDDMHGVQSLARAAADPADSSKSSPSPISGVYFIGMSLSAVFSKFFVVLIFVLVRLLFCNGSL